MQKIPPNQLSFVSHIILQPFETRNWLSIEIKESGLKKVFLPSFVCLGLKVLLLIFWFWETHNLLTDSQTQSS